VKTEFPAWAPPLLAVQFLTRVPVPGVAHLSGDAVRVALGRAVGWFPLVGALVGVATAGTLLLADEFWPRLVAVLLAFIVEARLTGAFHEDAVADFCDGMGGGRDANHIRQIMKDSRIGTYGALGLGLALALRVTLTYALPLATTAFAIIAAATFGRFLAAATLLVVPPAPAGEGLGKDVGTAVRSRDLALAALTALPGVLPFAVKNPMALLCALGGAAIFILWLRSLLLRKIGGSTGDCLGFAAYAGQLLVLLAATAW
jgi:adenosylcobinamide-GDP ribazoletransferase